MGLVETRLVQFRHFSVYIEEITQSYISGYDIVHSFRMTRITQEGKKISEDGTEAFPIRSGHHSL